jgi:hypothetical protein
MLPDALCIPDRIRRLPEDQVRKIPVPWFVAWVEGKPEFRAMDGDKLRRAIHERLCWVCGDTLGSRLVFVIGPMCAVNRISAEAPCHRECAEFSVRACPFLTKPHMVRRDNDMPANATEGAGYMIRRNPGVILLWCCRDYQLVSDGNGGVLFQVGEPFELRSFAEGREATLDEIRQSFDSGLPALLELAVAQGEHAVAALRQLESVARKRLGIV